MTTPPKKRRIRFDLSGFVFGSLVIGAVSHYGLGFGLKAAFILAVSAAFFMTFNDDPV